MTTTVRAPGTTSTTPGQPAASIAAAWASTASRSASSTRTAASPIASTRGPSRLRRVDDRLLRRTHAAPPPRRPVRRGRQRPSRPRRASPRARTPTRRGRRTSVPSTAVTTPSSTMRTTRAATSAGSWSNAPSCDRGTSAPSGVYPRSTKNSGTARSPAASAAASNREPGRPSTGNVASYARTASDHRSGLLLVVDRRVVQRAVRLHVPHARARHPAEALERADLVEHVVGRARPGSMSMNRRPNPARSRYATCAPTTTPPLRRQRARPPQRASRRPRGTRRRRWPTSRGRASPRRRRGPSGRTTHRGRS